MAQGIKRMAIVFMLTHLCELINSERERGSSLAHGFVPSMYTWSLRSTLLRSRGSTNSQKIAKFSLVICLTITCRSGGE